MSQFGDNIKLLRKRRKRSQEEIADALEIKRTSLSGYENGVAEPNYTTLAKLSEFFNLTIDKLLKVDLGAISESQLEELEKGYDIDLTGNRLRVLATTVNANNEENIELVPVAAQAGYTAGYADPDFIKVLPTFNLPFLSKEKKYRAFPISGDSMPPVSDGAWVTGEYVDNWLTLKNGYPYVIITRDDGVVFKRVENNIKEDKSLLLCSTNPAYHPYKIDVKDVLEVWKFVNYINGELPEANIARDQLTSTVLNLQKEVSMLKNTYKSQTTKVE